DDGPLVGLTHDDLDAELGGDALQDADGLRGDRNGPARSERTTGDRERLNDHNGLRPRGVAERIEDTLREISHLLDRSLARLEPLALRQARHGPTVRKTGVEAQREWQIRRQLEGCHNDLL